MLGIIVGAAGILIAKRASEMIGSNNLSGMTEKLLDQAEALEDRLEAKIKPTRKPSRKKPALKRPL